MFCTRAHVLLSTTEDSDYAGGSYDLTFDGSATALRVNISLTNDDVNEAVESFFARLSTSDDDATLSPTMAVIEVTDDDGEEQSNTHS